MNTGLVSMRYAKALLQAGIENKEISDVLYQNSTEFFNVLEGSSEFNDFLKSPVINGDKKKQFIRNTFGNNFHGMMMNFINLIIDNRREKLINNIFWDFLNIYRENLGIKNVKVITAIPVESKYKDEILKTIEKRLNAEVELECKVNPEVIGGLIIVVDDKQADGSIVGELRALKKKMMIN